MDALKLCLRCDESKPFADFYNDRRSRDGKTIYCKPCKDEIKREYERRNRATVALYYRGWRTRTKGAYSKHRNGWNARNPVKKAAHLAVYQAVKRGVLKREPCKVCGVKQVDAHHDDYAKPLDVRWLCRIHHKARHKELLQGF